MQRVSLSFPKFKIESETELVPFLKHLGIEDLFNGNANLKDITDGTLQGLIHLLLNTPLLFHFLAAFHTF